MAVLSPYKWGRRKFLMRSGIALAGAALATQLNAGWYPLGAADVARVVYNITAFGVTPSSDATVDRAAFEAFNVVLRSHAAIGQAVTLIVNSPTKDYVITGGSFLWMVAPGGDLRVEGTGSSINKGFMGVSPGWPFFDSLNDSALLQTVSANDTTVTLITLADHSKFAVNDWIAISSIDIQAFGYPQNNHKCQYAKITAKNTGTGVITLDRAMVDGHLSTLPLYLIGDETYPYQGGPATIWKMPADWNCKIHVVGWTRSDLGKLGFGAREIIMDDEVFSGANTESTPAVSASQKITINGGSCTFTGAVLEEDKVIEELYYNNHAAYNRHCQSSSIQLRVIDGGSTVTAINGEPRRNIVRNHTIGTVYNFGAQAFGYTESSLLENNVIPAFGFKMRPRAKTQFTVTATSPNVILRIPKNALNDLTWFVPLAKGYICDSAGTFNYGWPFQILSVTEDGTYAYATLDRSGTIPSPNGGDGTHLGIHPAINVSHGVGGNSGCLDALDLNNAPDNRPWPEYSTYTLTGNFGNDLSLSTRPQMGRLVRIRIIVSTADTGAVGTVSLKAMGGFAGTACRTIDADGTTLFNYAPIINLKVAGTRTITPGSVTGAQSGDSGLAIGSNWFCASWRPNLSANVSGNSAGQFAAVQIIVETNQDA